jgi:hypothetical protein
VFTSKPFIGWAFKLAAVYKKSRDRFFNRGNGSDLTKPTDDELGKGFEQKRNWSIRDKLSRT